MKDLNYYKNNCKEDYLHTPISVLRYITELEKITETKPLIIGGVIGSDDYHTIADKEVIEASRCPKCKSTDTLCCRLQKPNKCLDCGNTWT